MLMNLSKKLLKSPNATHSLDTNFSRDLFLLIDIDFIKAHTRIVLHVGQFLEDG